MAQCLAPRRLWACIVRYPRGSDNRCPCAPRAALFFRHHEPRSMVAAKREQEFFPALHDRGLILLPNTIENGSWCSFVDGASDPRNFRQASDRFPPYVHKVRRFVPPARRGFFCPQPPAEGPGHKNRFRLGSRQEGLVPQPFSPDKNPAKSDNCWVFQGGTPLRSAGAGPIRQFLAPARG